MGKKPRIVLDTNVWVSLALEKSLADELAPLIQRNAVEVCLSRPLLKELARVLTYPKISAILRSVGVEPIEALSRISKSSTMVRTWRTVREVKEDEADNRVLECALYSKATMVVSGDKHLLRLKEFRGVRILSPREFLDMMKDATRSAS